MIQPVKNNLNINFKGAPQRKPDDDGLQFDEINAIFRRRDAERAREQQERIAQIERRKSAQRTSSKVKSHRPNTQSGPQRVYKRTSSGDIIEYTPRPKTHTHGRKKKKLNPVKTTIAGLTALLTTFGIISCNTNQNTAQSVPVAPTAIIEESTVPTLSEEEIIEAARVRAEREEAKRAELRQAQIADAVEVIKSNPEMSQTYYNMIETINRMETLIDNPVGTISDILDEPYAEGVEMEMIIPQIFYESSGFHYDEDGSINSSSANCNGWMQVGVDAWNDMNKNHFSDNKLDRDVPVDNLKLGIAYDSELMNVYFGDDLFKVFAGYNCGPGNAQKGNYGIAAEYAENILKAYDILKKNPEFTQMLLNGELDEFQGEFRY